MTIRILNAYAGVGGNRKLWRGDINVTAIEIEPDIAKVYKDFYPNDTVIITDAHQYLLEHYSEFDFIWSSPPCPTHSVMGRLSMHIYEKNKDGSLERTCGQKEIAYPDMSLYQEIILLTHFFKGKWVVENTVSYYDPLIKPQESGSHYFWSNFNITNKKNTGVRAATLNKIKDKEKILGIDLSEKSFNLSNSTHDKDKVLNNCTEPKLGLHIFECAFKVTQTKLDVLQ